MKYLIDTQFFIWLMEKSNKVPEGLIDFLANPQHQIFLSVASIWELIIKKGKKKLKVPKNIKKDVNKSGFVLLPIEASHVMRLEKLPNLHSDPFDRILIAQSMVEDMILVTSDTTMQQYKARFLKLKN